MDVIRAKEKQYGFTLIELMVVTAIIAVLAGAVSLSLPSNSQRQVSKDAQKLAVFLEVVRVRSRSTGLPAIVAIQTGSYQLKGAGTSQTHLFSEGVNATPISLILGPEAVISPQSVYLFTPSGVSYTVKTNGADSFHVVSGNE